MSQEQQRWEVSQGLQHQQELEHTIASLRRQQARLTTPDPDVIAIIENLERNSQGLTAYFSAFLDPSIYNEMQPLDPRRSGSTPAAVKVLDLPELLEEVLGYVDPVDILRFHQVNQSARTLIIGSPRLRTTLGFRAAPEGSRLRLPFVSTTALSPMIANFQCCKYEYLYDEPIELDTDPSSKDRNLVRLRAGFEVSQGKATKIDERCRGMYITQPPVTYARVLLACCSLKHQCVQSDAGVTIGMLWDTRSELLEEHKLCPHAAIELHDAEGFVAAEPSFVIEVLRLPGVPLLPAGQRLGFRRFTYHRNISSRFLDRVKAYVNYKMDACQLGEAIMTLKELDTAGRLDKYIADVRQLQQQQQQYAAAQGSQVPVFNLSGSVVAQHMQGYNSTAAQPPMQLQNQIQNYVQHVQYQSQTIQALQAATQQQQQNTTQGHQAVQPPVTQQQVPQGQQHHTALRAQQMNIMRAQAQQMQQNTMQGYQAPLPTVPLQRTAQEQQQYMAYRAQQMNMMRAQQQQQMQMQAAAQQQMQHNAMQSHRTPLPAAPTQQANQAPLPTAPSQEAGNASPVSVDGESPYRTKLDGWNV
ncbi:hypothetical protein LTR56_001419 [Elasticomyces elasticus]|nr:hypothetical protein LTR56_001419 [Elasticomyces elasticus]KAK3668659.1 hypothetical protein LTR22_000546 [Elasticomyces elasticus]KAK4932011.1 hypothetical protein LTR49_001698 [Elasticomyces elasticus]KAK5768459.1 hypothetical protein LTS12_001247 [Elasticomyces elasticus]